MNRWTDGGVPFWPLNWYPKFMCWLLICAACCLYFLTGNSIQNVYNGKFSNANNDFSVKNVRN